MEKRFFCIAVCTLLLMGCTDESASSTGLCGNGVLDEGETCDDSNAIAGDGCSNTCIIETGYECKTVGSACSKIDGGQSQDPEQNPSQDPDPEQKCGNGTLDEGEVCDDGNASDGDGCSKDCLRVEDGYRCDIVGEPCILESCGNGVVDEGEECDEGDGNSTYADSEGVCSIRCKRDTPWCGDGIIDKDHEACDNGELNGKAGQNDYDGCTDDCTREGMFYCGDGLMTHKEGCDDGNTDDGDGCSSTCTVEDGWYCSNGKDCKKIEEGPVEITNCGNSKLDDGEACDDGNKASGDGCSSACQLETGYACTTPGQACKKTVCGDNIIEGTETCEDGNKVSGDGCSDQCQTEPGWYCENGKDCHAKACGDKIVAGDEECDDGNMTAGDGCDIFCQRESGFACPEEGGACKKTVCGDGKVEGDETCDEGKNTSNGGCVNCRIQFGYECLVPNQACTKTAVCGNGKLEGAETCDEGALGKTAGCSETCQINPGWRCPEANKPCIQGKCGDNAFDAGEECDDGNNVAGDGCDPMCKRETMFSCDKNGDCKPVCGDGITIWEAGEECDDGNRVSGDGCSSTCKIESGFACTKYSNTYPDTIRLPVTYRDFRAFYDGGTSPNKTCAGIGGKTVDGCINDQLAAKYGSNFKSGYGHPDFQHINASEKNIVNSDLGPDGRPVFNSAPATGITAASFDMWYRDYPGINQTFKEHIELGVTDKAKGVYQFASNAFFPLSGKGYGNFAQGGYPSQNFHFTSHIQTYFKYRGNDERLDFSGDDDVWVFVNGKRAIDLGGCHSVESDSFTLSGTVAPATGKKYNAQFGIHEGGIYPISFFHAERHTGASNFKLTLAGFLDMGTSSCASVCGDGIIVGDEECDIKGHTDDDEAKKQGCVNCKRQPVCGNGKIEAGEMCDTGDNAESWCKNCQLEPNTCGDGKLDDHEQCDEGAKNGTAESQCLKTCRLKGCGNGIVDEGEECDNGDNNGKGNCTEKCTKPRCGDGIVQGWLGEACDDGINDGAYGHCGLNCSYLAARCGDAVVDTMNGEECDNGINNGTYGTCTKECKFAPRCGDGHIDEGFEDCDDGELNGTEGHCPKYCQNVVN